MRRGLSASHFYIYIDETVVFLTLTSILKKNQLDFHHGFPNDFTLTYLHRFRKDQRWLLMTSSQTGSLEYISHFQKSNLCLYGNLPRRFHTTALVFVPKCSLLNSFSCSTLSKEIFFWFLCMESLKTKKIFKKCQRPLF